MLSNKTARITTALKTLVLTGESIGLYAGGFEYGVLIGNNNIIRYFDGDSYKHGLAWLPGLPVIESPYALRSRPVDHLVICKEHFYDSIANYLLTEIRVHRNMKIHSLESLLPQ